MLPGCGNRVDQAVLDAARAASRYCVPPRYVGRGGFRLSDERVRCLRRCCGGRCLYGLQFRRQRRLRLLRFAGELLPDRPLLRFLAGAFLGAYPFARLMVPRWGRLLVRAASENGVTNHTGDDGTARDKVTRVQRLRTLRDQTGHTYDVIACIADRGFQVRREDMRRLFQATDGKAFTLTTMHLLIDQTRIPEYRSRVELRPHDAESGKR